MSECNLYELEQTPTQRSYQTFIDMTPTQNFNMFPDSQTHTDEVTSKEPSESGLHLALAQKNSRATVESNLLT